MENFQKIAVLIDADNTQLTKLEAVLHEVSTYGRIVVKKAYGNWRKDSLKNWEPELKRLAIRAEQQFDYVAGKNTTDIASEKYQDADGFVNVSSSGLYIKRVKPDFNVRAYGYSKLPELLAAFPNKYQIKRYEGKGGATIIAYKCL